MELRASPCVLTTGQRGVASEGQGVLHTIIICTMNATTTGGSITITITTAKGAGSGSGSGCHLGGAARRSPTAIRMPTVPTATLAFLKRIVWEIVGGRIERRRGDGRADVFRLQRLT